MDCDQTLPHSSYYGEDRGGEAWQAFIWVEGPSGKGIVLVTDASGSDVFEKKYNSLMEALIVFKRIVKKKAIRMMVRNKSYSALLTQAKDVYIEQSKLDRYRTDVS